MTQEIVIGRAPPAMPASRGRRPAARSAEWRQHQTRRHAGAVAARTESVGTQGHGNEAVRRMAPGIGGGQKLMELVTAGSLLQIAWINVILSGDNAMVIALACRALRGRERHLGIVLGASAAVVLRIGFTLGLSEILFLPFARLVAGSALLVIAVKLLIGEDGEDEIKDHESLLRAMGTIVVADMIMSLDNVVAIAAAAKGSVALIVFGLAVSIPIVVAGSTLIVSTIRRFPVLVWIGSAFLGWIAGETIFSDLLIRGSMPQWLPDEAAAITGAAVVVAFGLAAPMWRKR